MSEITRVYQFRIWADDGLSVEYTFSDDDIEGVPRFGWSTPRALEGDVENIASVVRVVDASEQITAILSDGGGRAVLMGRIAEIRVNEAGAGLATVMKGRLTGIFMTEGVAAYDFHISNERWLEHAEVFGSGSTTQIVPPGIVSAWEDIPATRKVRVQVVAVVDTDRLTFEVLDDPGLLGSRIVNWLDSDIQRQSPSTGNFLYTRFRASGADRQLIAFGFADLAGPTSAEDPLGFMRSVIEGGEALAPNVFTVYWPTHGLSVDNEIADTYIYAPGAPADEDVPIHVGGTEGQDAFDWIKDQYDTIGVNYESDAFSAWNATTNPNGLISNPLIPPIYIRATKPEKLRAIVKKICKHFGIVPFVNSSGEVAPRFVTMPHDITLGSLTEVTAAIASPPHPTWGQQAANMVTVVRPTYSQYRLIREREVRDNSDVGTDRISHVIRPLLDFNHDRLSELESHVYEMDLTFINSLPLANYIATQMSREIFDRFGDGAIEGQIEVLSGGSTVEPGDFIKLTVSSYPNMATQARGGTRIVQAMGREQFITRSLSYLDAGPNSQPLSAPGVAIAQTAGDTHHSVDVTISSLTAGARYQLQLKVGSDEYRTVAEGSANETVTLTEMPSNTTIYARARETKANTIRSEWSSPVNVTTAALSAPTNLTVGSLAGDRGTATWTNNETAYHIEFLLDGVQLAILDPGTISYVITGLATSTNYNSPGAQVRYLDRYGGVSAADTDTFSTTGVNTTLDTPFATAILVGASI
jgi:hypothetical protein